MIRISNIAIEKWRNFVDLEVHIPADQSVICLIGENGTGKSNLLELVAALAHCSGLAPAAPSVRGNPFAEPHSLNAHLRMNGEVVKQLIDDLGTTYTTLSSWDGQFNIRSSCDVGGNPVTQFAIQELNPSHSQRVINHLHNKVNTGTEVNYLFLDSDRSYPVQQINSHEVAEGWTRDWKSPQWLRQRSAANSSSLYREWIHYMLARESQYAFEFARLAREQQKTAGPPPQFSDPSAQYSSAVKEILPHLEFAGVDEKKRDLLFRTVNEQIPFANLSGGEREIAFLIGQIDRFRLRKGLFLLDEPELHLNASLLRKWINFLISTIDEGQVWISTHSLEVVENLSAEAVMVLERKANERRVSVVTPLAERPALATLAPIVGSPAFSLSNRAFIYIEGDIGGQERRRFESLLPGNQQIVFLPAGSCRDVLRKVETLTAFSGHAEGLISVAGVIDRDFRNPLEVQRLTRPEIHILDCHEIENLFLQPEAISRLLEDATENGNKAKEVIREAADCFAGLWVLQSANASFPRPLTLTPQIRGHAGSLNWTDFIEDRDGTPASLIPLQTELDPYSAADLERKIREAVDRYAALRESDDLWLHCMGKQTLGNVPPLLGLSTVATMEARIVRNWDEGTVPIPGALEKLRQFLSDVGPEQT